MTDQQDQSEDRQQSGHDSGSKGAPDIQPSETEKSSGQSGDPGRTPGKAEGEDDSSATESGGGFVGNG